VSTPSSSSDLSFDATQPAWDVLAHRIDALLAAWDAGGTPLRLADFLPAQPSPLRRLILAELIKVDLEQRHARGFTLCRIEDYLAQFPELAGDGGVPCDLLYEEYHLRLRLGEDVHIADYQKRFPGQASELARLLGVHSTYQPTTAQAARPAARFAAGDRVDDFDLLTLLGEGAFAQVFLARQRSMQRLVALKVSADRGVEPQTLAQLDHAHIVRVYDQRLIAELGLRLLYMPYVAGGTLHSVLEYARTVPRERRGGRTLLEAIDRVLEQRGEQPPAESALRQRLAGLTWPQAVAWLGARLADALHYAHHKGVLHRDIKPANVLLSADGSPRLADFNVGYCSKVEGASAVSFFGGSLVYMSPEQMEAYNPAHERTAADLDGRSDLYSLGVTLWELLTGERPFADGGLGGGMASALLGLTNRRREGLPAASVANLPPGTPPGLARALRRCLEADRDRRFADAGQLARALELSLHPRAERLLEPPPGDPRRFVRRWPLLCMLATGLTPNVLAGVFNFFYNYTAVIHPSRTPGLEEAFLRIQTVINLTCFPLGVWVFVLLARPVLRGLARLRAGEEPSPAELERLRIRTLRLGRYGVWVGLGFWIGASIVYPVCLHVAVPDMPPGERQSLYVHFLASLTLCGLIAAAYPFFTGTALGTWAIYPAFLRPAAATARDRKEVVRLSRVLWPYLALAAAVPLLGVAVLVWVRSMERTVLGILCGAALVGLGVAVLLARSIQRDLADLAPVIFPPDVATADDDTALTRSWEA
jgi:serine/threonine protein kinase